MSIDIAQSEIELVFTMLKRLNLSVNEKVEPNTRGVQPLTSLSKALNVLSKLREFPEPVSLAQLSSAVGLNKVTTLRILVTLERFRFVEKDEKRYRIGRHAFYVGSGFITDGKRIKISQVMQKLVNELKHTITLSVLDGSSVLFVERVDGTERVKVTIDIGSRTAAYSSAAGKALLAGLTDGELKERFRGVKFEAFSPKTRTDIEDILLEIQCVRDNGFAINEEESTPGLVAIAVPVRSPLGEPVAALGAAFPIGVLNGKGEQREVAEQLRAAADEIEFFSNGSLRNIPVSRFNK